MRTWTPTVSVFAHAAVVPAIVVAPIPTAPISEAPSGHDGRGPAVGLLLGVTRDLLVDQTILAVAWNLRWNKRR
jgi:hypothetical protein